MKPSLQVFAIREAARAEPAGSYRNFLIIAPASAQDSAVSEEVKTLAHDLMRDGYTYVALPGQKEMEDDPSGVRYLPLRDVLPSFGLMTAVVVAGDAAWAARAADAYPDADVFLLQPTTRSAAQERHSSARRKKALMVSMEETLQGAA